ncbi:MAG: Uma2 family endonuclease [Clostridiales bacterium]|jgi:Uma2 family endonuclease|nr:Uma2 family endonuclease [Clostridiales bacterium]
MSAALKLDEKRYTYADLLNWPEDERWELIDGVPYLMGSAYGADAPHAMASPNRKHQKISANLIREFSTYLKDKTCEVYHAPFDVRLYADKSDKDDKGSDDTVVQPDLLVVCDLDKLADGKAVKGAPDLVVEVLSPSNSNLDTTKKFQKYHDARVPEIWFIDPEFDKIQIFRLINDNYVISLYGAQDIVPVGILPGFEIDMKEVFS